MQFSQPSGFHPTGFPNYGQPYAFNTPSPFQFNGYPEIIGEGNVTSVISPDGSTQLVFMPTTQWWRSYPPNVGNSNNPYLNNLGAWFVRSIYSPLQPTVFCQQYQTPCGGFLYPRASNSECCLNLPAPDFSLKFHNDNCTSTSDIQYFIPKQYNWFQSAKGCAAVQVEVPPVTNTVCHYEVLCTKPCNCIPAQPCSCLTKVKSKLNIQCMCGTKLNASNSDMSIEESKLDLNCKKSSTAKKSRKVKRTKSKKSTHYAKCECKEPTASDKSVTTYTEQASGCIEEKGRETQTACGIGIPMRTVHSGKFSRSNQHPINKKATTSKSCGDTEIWIPKTPMSKKAMTSKLSGTSKGLWEKACSESCSCDSVTESEN